MRVFGLMIGIFIGIAQAEWTISTASGLQLFPIISPDEESKGAFIAFTDMRPRSSTEPHGYEIYVQHVNSSGNTWSNDVAVSFPYAPLSGGKSQQHGHRLSPVICKGSSNGNSAIVCWINHHNLASLGGDANGIYCQKINKNGQLLWDGRPDKSGKQPIKITNSTNPPAICSDGAGGCVIVALEKDGKTIKAWRLLSDGSFDDNWGGKDGKVIRTGTTVAKNLKVVKAGGMHPKLGA